MTSLPSKFGVTAFNDDELPIVPLNSNESCQGGGRGNPIIASASLEINPRATAFTPSSLVLKGPPTGANPVMAAAAAALVVPAATGPLVTNIAGGSSSSSTIKPPAAEASTSSVGGGVSNGTAKECTTTKTVVDPLNPKLEVPVELIIQTRAMQRQGTPSICLLFLETRCRQGSDCNQVHVDPKHIVGLRAAACAMPTCCRYHGDVHAAKWPFYEQCTYLALTMEKIAIPMDRIAFTQGIQSLLDNSTSPMIQMNPLSICKVHAGGNCRYGEDCKFIHVCREFVKEQLAGSVSCMAEARVPVANKVQQQQEYLNRNLVHGGRNSSFGSRGRGGSFSRGVGLSHGDGGHQQRGRGDRSTTRSGNDQLQQPPPPPHFSEAYSGKEAPGYQQTMQTAAVMIHHAQPRQQVIVQGPPPHHQPLPMMQQQQQQPVQYILAQPQPQLAPFLGMQQLIPQQPVALPPQEEEEGGRGPKSSPSLTSMMHSPFLLQQQPQQPQPKLRLRSGSQPIMVVYAAGPSPLGTPQSVQIPQQAQQHPQQQIVLLQQPPASST